MTIPPARLRIQVEEHERWRRTLSVTVPADVMREERRKAVKRLARRLKLPGFRKGRVPASVLERQHGPELHRETVDSVIADAYRSALREGTVEPISQAAFEAVDYEPSGDLTFRVSFDVRPMIPLPRLGGFTLRQPKQRTIEPENVDEVIEQLREEHALWLPAEDDRGPGDGDLVTVRILRLPEGAGAQTGPEPASAEGPATYTQSGDDVGLPWARRLRLRLGTDHRGRYQFVLGQGDAVPDVEEAIRTLTPGETKDFTVSLPDGVDDEGRRGGDVRLRITLEDRRIRELPELDDTFARSLGDFDDVEGLRAKVQEDLSEDAAVEREGLLRARLLDLVLQANPFDVPLSMVDRYVEAMMHDAGVEDPAVAGRARDELQPDAELAVKRVVALDRIAELHGLRATPRELDERVAQIAEGGRVDPEEVRAQLSKTKRLEALSRSITETNVFDFLKRQSEILDET